MAALSDTRIRAAKATEKPYKLSDERGLYLLITPTGGRLGRLRYYMGGRENLLALGAYPDVTLKRAREKRDEVSDGIDPNAKRKAELSAQAETFEAVATEWLELQIEREIRITSPIRAARGKCMCGQRFSRRDLLRAGSAISSDAPTSNEWPTCPPR